MAAAEGGGSRRLGDGARRHEPLTERDATALRDILQQVTSRFNAIVASQGGVSETLSARMLYRPES
jgi:hypothetical protein